MVQLYTEPLNDEQLYAFNEVSRIWSSSEWDSFNTIVEKESGWDNTAQNPKSTAYGIGQFLDSTWDIVGCKKTSDPYEQIDCKIKYIEQRYGTPTKALEFHLVNNWY